MAKWKVTIEIYVEAPTSVSALFQALADIITFGEELALCQGNGIPPFKWKAEKIEEREGHGRTKI